jgi:Tfp pilus assembly protein PilE
MTLAIENGVNRRTTMKRGMTMTLMLAVVVAALAAPVALYPMYTGVRARWWEHGVKRDAQGVLQGAQSYEVGGARWAC